MSTVSGQILGWLREAIRAAAARDAAVSELLADLDRAHGPLSWHEFAAWCDRAESALGGADALRKAARAFAGARLAELSAREPGFGDTRQALWVACQVLAPGLLPDLAWRLEPGEDGRLAVEVHIPDDLPASPAFFALLEGALAAAPRVVDLPFARVTAHQQERSARFEIRPATPATSGDAQTRLAALANHSRFVFIEADADGVIRFVSPNCEEIFGYRAQDLIDRKAVALAPGGLPGSSRRLLSEVDAEPRSLELPFRRPDGGPGWVATTFYDYRTAAGERRRVAIAQDITARKQVEQARAERAELLERVARATPDALMVFDLESGRMNFLTEGGITCLGLSREFYMRQHTPGLDGFIHPDDLPEVTRHRQRALELPPGGVAQVEARVRHADGSWRWLRFRDVVFSRNAEGRPREMLISIGDVTEKVRITEALRENEERYRRVSELASDYSFCVTMHPDGSLGREWVTGAFTRITGYAPEELPPESWERLIHPDDRAYFRGRQASRREAGSGVDEFRIVTRSGETRSVREHYEVVALEGGGTRWYGACQDVTEQRLAEEARLMSERRHRAITENSWDAIAELDANGVPVYLSPNVRDVLGWESEDLVGRPDTSVIHPDDRDRVVEKIAKLLRGGGDARLDYRVRHRDGGWRHVEVTATAFLAADGERRTVLIGHDVTERLRGEEERERLGSVVSATSELIAIFEPDGQLLFLNRAGRRLMGWGGGALRGRSLFDLFEASEATRVRQEGLDTALHGGGWEGECRLHPAENDGPVDVLANVFRLPDPRVGESRTLALVARDIRGRKRAELALHESEQRLRTLVENAFDMIAEVDADGRFVYASPRYQELLGYDPKALVGEEILDLVHPEDRGRIEAAVDSVEERPETNLGPLRVRSRDGRWLWFENQVRPYVRQSGDSLLVVVSRDITSRRETEDALQESQEQLLQSQKMEAIGRLAGGVAHDFNNLLTAITGYGDLLLQELGEGDPLRDDAEEILRAADQASRLTRQLLAFSRRQVLQPRVVELNAHVSDIDRLLRRLIGEHVELVSSLAPDVGAVRVDPGQLEQLVVNLAVNARDAMPRGGRLELTTASLELDEADPAHAGVPPGDWLTLAVRDTGIGMDDEILARIFEPFFTTKEIGKGTGLGLSTVYGIVQQSGGHIRAESTPGEGSCFTLYLQRCQAPLDAVPPHPVLEDLRGQETVVLVEDEDSVRKLLRRYLEEHGYTVIDAASGVEALRAVRLHEGPIDALVTDMVLPRMHGRALAARLASEHPGLRVLFISGFSNEELTDIGAADATGSLIQKPFSPPELLQRLRTVLMTEAD